MRRRWGLAKIMVMTIAFAVAISTVAIGEEFTINSVREAEALASMLSREYGMQTNPFSLLEQSRGNERSWNSGTGELYANMMGTSINAQREFRRTLPSIFSYSQTAHYQNRADAGAASGDALANFAPESYYTYCPTTMCSPGSKWVMWDVPFLTKETHKAEDGYLGYEQNVSGFSTGISRMIGESSAVGLSVGYDRRKLKTRDDYVMENKGDTLHLALYGGTNIGCLFVDGYAGFSRTWNKTKRQTDFSQDFGMDGDRRWNEFGEARPHDNVYSAGVKASYVWIFGNDMRLTPSLGVDFSHVRMGGSSEQEYQRMRPEPYYSLIANDKSNFTSVAMPLMLSLNKTYSSSFLAFGGYNSLWTPEIRGGYVQQFGARHATVDISRASTQFAQVPPQQNYSYTAESTRFNRSYSTVGAGLKIKLRDKYIFNIDYDYSVASKWNHHSLTAMYGASF